MLKRGNKEVYVIILVVGVLFSLIFLGEGITGAAVKDSGQFFISAEANSSECGFVTASLTLTNNVTNRTTCFYINASNIVLDCNGSIINHSTSSYGFGVNITGKENVTVKNCVIMDGNISDSNYGVVLDRSNNSRVYNNSFQIHSLNGIGVYLKTDATGNNISNNSFYIPEYNPNYGGFVMQLDNLVINNLFSRNIINSSENGISSGALHNAIYDNSLSHTNNLTHNIFRMSGQFSNAIRTSAAFLDQNLINITGADSIGIIIENGGTDTATILNTNITSTYYTIQDSDADAYTDVLIYNNSLGQITWNLSNLTTNVTRISDTIFLQQGLVGLTNSPDSLNLNGTAKIEIKNLPYMFKPMVLKNGVRCDNTNVCNISYSNNILYANISSFSNYTTDFFSCGYLNAGLTLNNSVNSTGTCFVVNSSSITIDCAGNTILYGVSTAGYGINNTNFNNVTVKNCIINKGLGTGTQSYGIYFSNSSNHTITNNTINTNGTSYAYGIYFDRANQSRINNSVITTTWGASSSGIVNYASNNNITGNTISVNGTSDSYGMDIQGNNNIVFRNMVSTNGNANANYGIYISGTSNTVNSSNISTYGTTRNRGIFLDGTTSSTIINSIIITNGSSTFNAGIEVDGATSSVIRGNKINTTGTTDNYGIYVLDSTLIVGSLSTKNINIQTVPSSTTIDSNEVNSNGSSSPNYALYLRHATTTTILNNNFTSISRDYSIFDDYGRNILIYNNSYGQINWSVSNLTTNISLKIGETIFLENNNIGLTSSNQKLNLTGPARIELRQLSYTTPQLLKNGTRCDNSNACNITYSGSTLYALVSSFSNYSAQETPTDSSSSSSSSSGGGGGGPSGASGGISTGAAGKFAQETWTSINAGEIAAVKVENGEIGITEITFATEKTTYGAWVKVEKVENLPSSVPSFVGETYRNIKISHSNIEKAIKGSATIQFKVEKSWLVDHKTSSDEVVLYRNIENKWVQLTTTVGEDDGTYVHYTAETPGFSYFVIGVAEGAVSGVAKDVEDVSKDVVAAAEPAAEETAGEQIISLGKNMKWKWLLPLIVAVIAAFALIWIYTKK